jgi:hypothetical protein
MTTADEAASDKRVASLIGKFIFGSSHSEGIVHIVAEFAQNFGNPAMEKKGRG